MIRVPSTAAGKFCMLYQVYRDITVIIRAWYKIHVSFLSQLQGAGAATSFSGAGI